MTYFSNDPCYSTQGENLKLNDISLAYRTQAWAYVPCNALSDVHDLTCGHRVKTEIREKCGSNCSNPMSPVSTAFVCRACTAQAILEGLGLLTEDDIMEPCGYDIVKANGIACSIVEDEVRTLTNKGHREATPIFKSNGLAEFVKEYGTKVLKVSEQEMVVVEKQFWGMDIKTPEEKMEKMDYVFDALGLSSSNGKGKDKPH